MGLSFFLLRNAFVSLSDAGPVVPNCRPGTVSIMIELLQNKPFHIVDGIKPGSPSFFGAFFVFQFGNAFLRPLFREGFR